MILIDGDEHPLLFAGGNLSFMQSYEKTLKFVSGSRGIGIYFVFLYQLTNEMY